MYLYQVFNLRMLVISIFQRLYRVYRYCIESLDLTYKLIALKINSIALDRIYFLSREFREHIHCYDKRKK